MQYFFILGRNPELSLAELIAVLPKHHSIILFIENVVIVECSEIDAPSFTASLGGTIKMGKILANINKHASSTDILPLLNFAKDKKIFLGISAYSVDSGSKLPDVHKLRQLGIEMKRILQNNGYKIRLVTSKEQALSSVIVEKERLLRQGGEIVLLYGKDNTYIAQTLAVQEFERASIRDFKRPSRAMSVGMLPVQLTKILINLSRSTKQQTLLDPFCGLGTVLSEAMVMGYENLVGSDIESAMIKATEENLNWLIHLAKIKKPNIKLFQSSAQELSKHTAGIDLIVTEPLMGPTRGHPNIDALSELYIQSFEEFKKILNTGAHVVFIFPSFKQKNRIVKISEKVLDKIKKIGFKPIELLPKKYSITYSRENQKVLREIFVFEYEV